MCPIALSSQEEMRCYLEQQHQGHQQLVTCMDVVGNTVLTGSQDHTLKVSSHKKHTRTHKIQFENLKSFLCLDVFFDRFSD